MGYTHYFKSKESFTDAAWNSFVNDAKQLFANTKIPIGNGHGEPGTDPIITENTIIFNGIEDDSHESCCVSRYAVDFEFCKTAYKPYDSVVVEFWKLARKHNPSIELSSDGGREVFGFNAEELKYNEIASFAYDDKYRSIGVTSRTDEYLCGHELNVENKPFKKFKTAKIRHLNIETVDKVDFAKADDQSSIANYV